MKQELGVWYAVRVYWSKICDAYGTTLHCSSGTKVSTSISSPPLLPDSNTAASPFVCTSMTADGRAKEGAHSKKIGRVQASCLMLVRMRYVSRSSRHCASNDGSPPTAHPPRVSIGSQEARCASQCQVRSFSPTASTTLLLHFFSRIRLRDRVSRKSSRQVAAI